MDEGIPDLSVVCPTCGSKVSPYITECPYCGNRVRKRAPKIGSREDPARQAMKAQKRQRARRSPPPMPRLPTIGSARGRLVAVPGLLVVAVALSVLVRAGIVHAATVEVHGPIHGDWPKLITAPFVHRNITYGFIVLALFAIFGSKVEHRSGGGPIVVLLTWLIAGAGGAWLSAETTVSPAAGALAPAMAVTFACGMAALDARRGGDDVDLAGVGVSLVVLALLPALVLDATWQALGVGVVIGTGLGSALTWLDRREANA